MVHLPSVRLSLLGDDSLFFYNSLGTFLIGPGFPLNSSNPFKKLVDSCLQILFGVRSTLSHGRLIGPLLMKDIVKRRNLYWQLGNSYMCRRLGCRYGYCSPLVSTIQHPVYEASSWPDRLPVCILCFVEPRSGPVEVVRETGTTDFNTDHDDGIKSPLNVSTKIGSYTRSNVYQTI